MNKYFKYHFYLGLIICFINLNSLSAQQPDTRLRSQVSIEYKATKDFDISASYRYDLDNNISTFSRSNIELGLDYSILKWLDVDASYRFMTSYNKDAHRFKAGMSVEKKTSNKKFQFQWKSAINLNSDYLDRDYWQMEDPEWVWRNKLKTKYDISKKVSVSVFIEQFLRLKQSQSYFYRNRIGTALDYDFKKRHSFSLGYFYQIEYNIKNPEQNNTIEVEYKFELKKKKKAKTKLTPEAQLF